MTETADNDDVLTQQDVWDAEEEDLRDALQELIGERAPECSVEAIRTAFVMGILAVKYESPSWSETANQFINRRNEIMATTIKSKLNKAAAAKADERAAAAKPAKAPKAEKAPKDAAAAPRGRAPTLTKVKANPEGGTSKMQETSERYAVYQLIKKAGAKGITIEALDEQFGKATRGFVLKLIEKSWVLDANA